MTDSIQMSAAAGCSTPAEAVRQTLDGSSLQLSVYTATKTAGTIAFASRLPGRIVSIAVAPGSEFLVHRRGFLAGTPGIEITTGFRQQLLANGSGGEDFVLQRIGGRGHAWVELSGDVITRDLATGASLRTHPWHIGMCGGSVAVQMAEYHGIANRDLGSDPRHLAVLSGPGVVWLQSMQLLAAKPNNP